MGSLRNKMYLKIRDFIITVIPDVPSGHVIKNSISLVKHIQQKSSVSKLGS